MNKLLASATCLAAIAAIFILVGCAKGAFMGSALTTTYHDPSCVWADQIDKERQVWFEDAAAAEAAGYQPCATCAAGSQKADGE